VLGFRVRGDTLSIEPVIPMEWPGFEIRYRYRSATFEIKVQREVSFASTVVQMDGVLVPGNVIRLIDDGLVHKVLARIPKSQLLLPSGDRESQPAIEPPLAYGRASGAFAEPRA
jgi:hypothetical protein